MDNETQPVEIQDANIVFQQDKAAIDIQISTAKTYPRNIKRAVDNAVATVTMDKETASICTYSLPRDGKAISGPSVHLAKILAQYWGNLRIEAKVIDIGTTQITSQAIAFDLENNLAVKMEVKRSISGRKGRFSEDMITVTGNAANAIALRNAIFSVIPRNIVDKVYNAAKQTITGDVSDENKLVARRKQVVDGLKDTYNVTEVEILSAIGKAAITHITADDLVVLIGIGQAIRDGDTTVDEAFKNRVTDPKIMASEKEESRIIGFIETSTTIKELAQFKKYCTSEKLKEAYDQKAELLSQSK